MLTYYGAPIDGQAETALKKEDGVIPDERQMYLWIKAAFRHFFNNVQKDPQVQIDGVRSCRLAARVPPARDRHPARASAERTASGRHDADQAPPLPTWAFRTSSRPSGEPRPAAGQRSPNCRKRDGHDRRRHRGPGRSDVPGDRFAHETARATSIETSGSGPARYGSFAEVTELAAQCPERHARPGKPARAVQVLPGSAPPAAAGRGPAAQVRERWSAHRRQPPHFGRHARLSPRTARR